MSSQPNLIKRSTPPNRDRKGRADYLVRLPLWRRYPKTIILGGGFLASSAVWGYPLYMALFYTAEDIPYQGDWWPSEKAKGKRIVEQYRERQEKLHIWKEEFDKEQAAKAAAKAQLAKVVVK